MRNCGGSAEAFPAAPGAHVVDRPGRLPDPAAQLLPEPAGSGGLSGRVRAHHPPLGRRALPRAMVGGQAAAAAARRRSGRAAAGMGRLDAQPLRPVVPGRQVLRRAGHAALVANLRASAVLARGLRAGLGRGCGGASPRGRPRSGALDGDARAKRGQAARLPGQPCPGPFPPNRCFRPRPPACTQATERGRDRARERSERARGRRRSGVYQ